MHEFSSLLHVHVHVVVKLHVHVHAAGCLPCLFTALVWQVFVGDEVVIHFFWSHQAFWCTLRDPCVFSIMIYPGSFCVCKLYMSYPEMSICVSVFASWKFLSTEPHTSVCLCKRFLHVVYVILMSRPWGIYVAVINHESQGRVRPRAEWFITRNVPKRGRDLSNLCRHDRRCYDECRKNAS